MLIKIKRPTQYLPVRKKLSSTIIKFFLYLLSDVIKTGPYRDLYLPNTLISSSEDAANNFARGFYTNGKLQLEEVNPLLFLAKIRLI